MSAHRLSEHTALLKYRDVATRELSQLQTLLNIALGLQHPAFAL
jgi:hypothetical protein